MNPILISAEQLQTIYHDPDTIILDASIEFQIPGESPKITGKMIPNAIQFDYDKDFCNRHTLLPHMFPSEKLFNERAQALGINNSSTIVIYDNAGTYASPRAWWMFQAMGHKKVLILDGGLPAWIANGGTTTAEYREVTQPGDFSGTVVRGHFIDAQQVLTHSEAQNANIIDARSQARFDSKVPEPRKGLRSGHIPHSICLPFASVLNGGRLKGTEDLKNIFNQLPLNESNPMIFSCGSGVTACILLVASYIAGYQNSMSVYDGSWTEWGANSTLPIAVTQNLSS